MPELNYIAILVSAIITMIIGALWYSPLLFGNIWMKLMGFTEKTLKDMKAKANQSYALGFVSTFVIATAIAYMLDATRADSLEEGIQLALVLWLGFIATHALGSVLWEGKSPKLYLINIAYNFVTFLVMGAILVSWV